MDSILKSEDDGFPIRSTRNVLYSAATPRYLMDRSVAPIEEDEVNSPPPKICIRNVASPSLLRPRRILESPTLDRFCANGDQLLLHEREGAPSLARRSMVCLSPFSLALPMSLLQCAHLA